MAVVNAYARTSYTIGTAQASTGDSTSTLDRTRVPKDQPVAVELQNTAGTTITVQILGSQDGTTWYKVAYALTASPETVAVADITMTTTVTNIYILRPYHPWRYLKVTRTANTGCTLTSIVHF